MTDKKQILGTSKSEDDNSILATMHCAKSSTDEMPKVFLVKTIREPVSDNPFPKEDFNVIELTPSELSILRDLLRQSIYETIQIDGVESSEIEGRENLLKKLSEVSKC